MGSFCAVGVVMLGCYAGCSVKIFIIGMRILCYDCCLDVML